MSGRRDMERHDASRRTLLRRLAGGLPGALFLSRWSRLAAVAGKRELSFHHTHTGERLSIVYYADGDYLAKALDEVTGDVHPMDPELLDVLYDLRLATGSSGIYEVISAYRSPRTNEMLRRKGRDVAKKSMHVQGRAIDVRLTDLATVDLRDGALRLARGGVGYYRKSDFVHVDTGRVRRW
jgi:uncharacterized protein YcbK (DUF882 family)